MVHCTTCPPLIVPLAIPISNRLHLEQNCVGLGVRAFSVFASGVSKDKDLEFVGRLCTCGSFYDTASLFWRETLESDQYQDKTFCDVTYLRTS